MLRGAAVAGATLPFLKLRYALDAWEQSEAAYAAPSSDGRVVRLSHNENPYGPSPKARKALIAAIDQGNRYPREAISNLEQKIAEHEGLDANQVMISAGSAELLGLAGLMVGMHEGNVISCHPTFPVLMHYASQLASEWRKVPLTEDHQYNLAGINAKVDKDTRLVFICNPNNPTGGELPKTMLEPFCQVLSQRTRVYVDEAYIEFAAGGIKASLAHLTKDNPNIIVGRTFSKIYGMAGLRVGYAIAHPDTITEMRRLQPGMNITPSVTSVEAASASIGDEEFIASCLEKNAAARELIYEGFTNWGIEYIPSSTNFIFFRTDRFADQNVTASLRAKNVMIRSYGDVPGWARVSIGTVDEVGMFLGEVEGLLG
jgi:histidinol-phosphate aminotransferase